MNSGKFQQRRNIVRKVRGTNSSPLMQKGSSLNETPSSRSHLFGINVIKQNAIIVTGLSPSDAKEEILKKQYGKYGKICRFVLNPSNYFDARQRDINDYKGLSITESKTSCVAYIAYISEKGATNAVRNAEFQLDETNVRVTFVTTRYCDHFLKGDYCEDRNCLYLHEVTPEHNREDTNNCGKKILSLVEESSENLVEERSLFSREDSGDAITRTSLYMNSYAIKESSVSVPPQKKFDASVGGCNKFILTPETSAPPTFTGLNSPFAFQSPVVITKQNFVFQTKKKDCIQRQSQPDFKGKSVDSKFMMPRYNSPNKKKSIENFHIPTSKPNFPTHHYHDLMEYPHVKSYCHGLESRFHANHLHHSQFRRPIYYQRSYGQIYNRQKVLVQSRTENVGYYYRNNGQFPNANVPSWNKDVSNRNSNTLHNLKMYHT